VDAERGGGVIVRERIDWVPPAQPAHIVKLAEDARRALIEHLSPWDARILGPSVSKLLAHRWRQKPEVVSAEMHEALIIDWIEDLGEFPAWAFHDAAREWRRTQQWCPTIADIRRLCEAAVADDRRTLRLIERLLAA